MRRQRQRKSRVFTSTLIPLVGAAALAVAGVSATAQSGGGIKIGDGRIAGLEQASAEIVLCGKLEGLGALTEVQGCEDEKALLLVIRQDSPATIRVDLSGLDDDNRTLLRQFVDQEQGGQDVDHRARIEGDTLIAPAAAIGGG